jgi:succinoglycan biosynthesis protein ExoM
MTTRVQVCVLTFKRKQMLRAALESLQQQDLEGVGADIQILVVDNDAAESGRAVVGETFAGACLPQRYVVEPKQGIARARNRALEDSGECDFVAFMDDDETADPNWLKRLLEVQGRFDADVVTGPVVPRYLHSPEWILRGGFFAPRREATGRRVRFVQTNNVLIRRSAVGNRRFDLRFDSTGGEDTDFFMRLDDAGARMVWADDAKVYETISEDRASLAWIVRRAFTEASNYTACRLRSTPGAATVVSRVTTAFGGFCFGGLLLLAGISGRHRCVQGLRLISRALGTIYALAGLTHPYYASRSYVSPQG